VAEYRTLDFRLSRQFRSELVAGGCEQSATRAFLLRRDGTIFPQASMKIDGLSEPPELSGPPKKFNQPTEVERQLAEIVGLQCAHAHLAILRQTSRDRSREEQSADEGGT
jgi:hypothetical protein